MNQLFRLTLFTVFLMLVSLWSYAQHWTEQPLNKKADSLKALYSWEVHDEFHSAGGEITLLKDGRFYYFEYHPLNYYKHSDGTYQINNGVLTLKSYLQANNLQVSVNYPGNAPSDSLSKRLGFVVNSCGDTLFNAYYFLNYDTSFKMTYDPMFPENVDPFIKLRSIRVMIYDSNLGSPWIKINYPDQIMKVTVLTNLDGKDDYIILNNWKFKVEGKRLIELNKKN